MENVLQRLAAIDGVTGALLVGTDGVVRASTLPREEEELLGAMAAAAFDAANRYIAQLGAGPSRIALFETQTGTVQVAAAADALLVARTNHSAALGRVRLELLRVSGGSPRRGGR